MINIMVMRMIILKGLDFFEILNIKKKKRKQLEGRKKNLKEKKKKENKTNS